jgi:Bacterial Ig-like domain (group 3)
MHKLVDAACRRAAGIGAGVILTGGLVGGVLLTPGTAYAATPVDTTTAITGTTQTSTPPGTTLNVQVSVTAASGTVWPAGIVKVSAGWGGCALTLTQEGSSAVGVGNCSIDHLRGGTYTLTAKYEGSDSFNWSVSNPDTVTIGSAPVFDADSPPLTAVNGQGYSYTFHADGSPAPGYALDSAAPGWLHINPGTGTVWGTVPDWVTSFSYSVTATNSQGSATAGPYTVFVNHGHRHGHGNVDTFLSCTAKVFTGQRGSCTLFVTNRGFGPASDVTAQVALPAQLRADYCGYFFNFGCRIFDNTAFENLGTLNPGQTKTLTVVFTARTGFGLFGWHRGHPFTVRVVGSAASFPNFGFDGHRVSFSIAYVTIIPRGHWW